MTRKRAKFSRKRLLTIQLSRTTVHGDSAVLLLAATEMARNAFPLPPPTNSSPSPSSPPPSSSHHCSWTELLSADLNSFQFKNGRDKNSRDKITLLLGLFLGKKHESITAKFAPLYLSPSRFCFLLGCGFNRKLAELGYHRSAKKCKEKFANVHKYYKRTKEGRAGRQDGKSYRFFSQLEALHGNTSGANTTSTAATTSAAATAMTSAMVNTIQATTTAATGGAVSATRIQSPPRSVTLISSGQPSRSTVQALQGLPRVAADISGGLSFSSGGSSTSGESSDGAEDQGHRKRKRSSGSSTQKMMDFFEGLMKQVVEKQVTLQQRFLEAIEKREEDRMIREEAWKRQEMARLSRELEYLAQERAMLSSRDAALISFLQKVTGHTINLPPPPQPPPPQPTAQPVSTAAAASAADCTAAPPSIILPISQQQQQPPQRTETRAMPTTTSIVIHEQEQAPPNYEPASSRWPKAEVLALINLRSGLEPRYQEAGPKGPLWEEISAEMAKMCYKRSAKRCKEKWENINKYFKKVKESNKKRPEDGKTCPYFYQLDALYRKKILGRPTKLEAEAPEQPVLPDQSHISSAMAIMPTPISAAPPETESGDGDSEGQVHKGNGEGGQSTSGFYTSVVDKGNGMGAKKKTL